MNDFGNTMVNPQIHSLRGVKLLRGLQRVLPLGRKYHSLLSILNASDGLVAIPFRTYQVLLPATWHKPIATTLLMQDGVIPEFRLLAPICQQLDKGYLLDVGANIGLYTLLLRANSSLPVIAYEPQPHLCDLIRHNVTHNQFENIEVRNVGCGAESGEVPFYTGTNGSVALGLNAPSSALTDGLIKVPIRTLDEDLADVSKIALLKIDCEGFEYNILQGAKKLIEQHKPQLFIEIHPAELEKFGHSAQMVIDFLRPLYEMEFWCFHPLRLNKLARSIAKFRVPKGFRYASGSEMLNAVKNDPRPSQIYCVGRPR